MIKATLYLKNHNSFIQYMERPLKKKIKLFIKLFTKPKKQAIKNISKVQENFNQLFQRKINLKQEKYSI